MRIKQGVKISGIRPEIVLAINICNDVFASLFKHNPKECVVTSAVEGQHSTGSLHYVGCAVDIRTRHLGQVQRAELHKQVIRSLGSEFDVLLEGDHLHIEFQPK